MYNVHSARPGKCQKSYTNKIVRNQFGVKFTLSTVVKTHINSNIPIVITGPFRFLGQSLHINNICKNEGVGGEWGPLLSFKQKKPKTNFRSLCQSVLSTTQLDLRVSVE